MIVRIWTTQIAAGRETEYLAFAQERSRLMFLSQPGCLGVLFLKADDRKHAACSFWNSMVDIESLANSPSYSATVSALVATGVLLGEATTTVYEVEGGVIDGTTFSHTLHKLGVASLPK